MSLTESRAAYKPFQYPWAYEAFKLQNQIHWLPEEVPMAEDVKDWTVNLNEKERHLITQIFRFFTQADVEVADNYMERYTKVFKPTEVKMMLGAFTNMEGIHVDAYSTLIDTIGMPETEYEAFLKYDEMKKKCDYFHSFSVENKREIAKTLAGFGAFVEGMQLFASFAILLNFTRFNRMKGMGQIITWSVRDETLHCNSLIKLFRIYVQENSEIWDDELKEEIYSIAEDMVKHEDAFIDLAFEMGGVKGLDPDDVKRYIRYIADRRLIQLGMKNIFKVKDNPLPWMDEILNGIEHANFFEVRATEYARASTKGTWQDAFEIHS
jgi:ribonucleoside-diphosphate reductase beta chain